jgi:hypothetical protein
LFVAAMDMGMDTWGTAVAATTTGGAEVTIVAGDNKIAG